MGLLSTIREEWPVIKQAPFTITITVLILASTAAAVIYGGFRENLARKDDLITTLRSQLEAKKSEKPDPGKTDSGKLPPGPMEPQPKTGSTRTAPPKITQKADHSPCSNQNAGRDVNVNCTESPNEKNRP
jgi:hypothetical protein